MVTVDDVTLKSATDEVIPEITLTVDGEEIAQDGNYNVEVSADVAAGKGTVTVTGINNYCDSVTKEFNINTAQALLGDANGDGEVDMVDATIVQRAATNLKVPYSEEQIMCADIDGDEELTVVDATFIQRYATKIATPYKIGEPISK